MEAEPSVKTVRQRVEQLGASGGHSTPDHHDLRCRDSHQPGQGVHGLVSDSCGVHIADCGPASHFLSARDSPARPLLQAAGHPGAGGKHLEATDRAALAPQHMPHVAVA